MSVLICFACVFFSFLFVARPVIVGGIWGGGVGMAGSYGMVYRGGRVGQVALCPRFVFWVAPRRAALSELLFVLCVVVFVCLFLSLLYFVPFFVLFFSLFVYFCLFLSFNELLITCLVSPLFFSFFLSISVF